MTVNKGPLGHMRSYVADRSNENHAIPFLHHLSLQEEPKRDITKRALCNVSIFPRLPIRSRNAETIFPPASSSSDNHIPVSLRKDKSSPKFKGVFHNKLEGEYSSSSESRFLK